MFCPLRGLEDSFSWALQARGSCFAVPLLLLKYVFLLVFPSRSLLSQKDFLHPASSDAGFVLRVRLALGSRALGGRAAGRGALWGAQVVHQREAILPTEVNELDLSDAAVKVDTPAFRIGTVAGQAQIPDKILWEIAGSVGNIASFNCASSQFLKAWGIVGQVTDKPNHQWVPTQAQLFQVNQVNDLSRKVSQQVIVQAKGTQGMQLCQLRWNTLDLVVTQNQIV